MIRENKAKLRMLSGKPALGVVLALPSVGVAKTIGGQGYDFLLVDAQHGDWDLQTIGEAMRGVFTAGSIPMVRVLQNDPYAIGSVLDRGALGVVVPMVETVEDAKRAAGAARYGQRGYRSIGGGSMRDWLPIGEEEVCDEVFLAVQIETELGVENAADILAVDGVDGCWVGPSDLSLSLGLGVAPKDEQAERIHEEAIQRVLTACRATGKVPGICGAGPNDRWLEAGFQFVTVTVDLEIIRNGAQAIRATYS